MVRRLPVIQSAADTDPVRPRWHWPLIGGGLVATSWAPFVLLLASHGPVPLAVAFVAVAFGAGVVVGRFGAPAGVREAALAGPVAATAVSAVALLAGAGVGPAAAACAVLAISGGLASLLGGWIGVRRRPDVAPSRPLA
jgi:hypothetical protein